MVVDRQAVFAGQRDGIGNFATFGNGIGSRQLGHHFVDGVSHFHRRGAAKLQVLEGTACSIGR